MDVTEYLFFPYRLNGLGGISFCQSQFLGYSAVINITNIGFHIAQHCYGIFSLCIYGSYMFALIQAFRLFLFLGERLFQ